MTDHRSQFAAALAAAGLKVPDEILADGKIHRFSTNCRADDDAGWYLYYDSPGGAVGAFGCRRAGISTEWHADPNDDRMVLSESQKIESRFISLSDHPEAVQAPPNTWLIEKWQPRGIGITYGTTGYLKSFFELWQAIQGAAGRDVLGHRIATASGYIRTLIFHNEDVPDQIEYDLNRMAAKMDLSPAEIEAVSENLRVIPVADIEMEFGRRVDGRMATGGAVKVIAETAYDFQADLVILDTISGIEPSSPDFGERALTVMRGFYKIIQAAGCGVHGIAHVSKEVSRSDIRDVGSILGSVHYGNKARVARWVAKPTDEEKLLMPASIRDLLAKADYHGQAASISILGVSKLSHSPPIDDCIWLGRSSHQIIVERVAGGSDVRQKAREAKIEQATALARDILAAHPNGIGQRDSDAEIKIRGGSRDYTRLALAKLVERGEAVYEPVAGSHGGAKMYRLKR